MLLLAGSISVLSVLYAVWPMACAFNPLAITTTLLFGLGNTLLSISAVAEHGSLLCSAIIFAYTTWLCYATLAAFPEAECNPLHSGEAAHAGALVASCAVAGLSLGYIAYAWARLRSARTRCRAAPLRRPPLRCTPQPIDCGERDFHEPGGRQG